MFNDEDRRAFMQALKEANPNPKSELDFETPFQLLVAVVLSAQTTDKAVNAVTKKLFAIAPTAPAMAKLGAHDIEMIIQTIGLYRNKAKNVATLATIIAGHYNGRVPQDFDSLVALPGVGRKTANVVLNVAFGQPTIAVDTHIFRVCNRTGFAPGATPAIVESKLMQVVPEEFLCDAHHWLLLHGRYCCKARQPLCEQCPVTRFCHAPEKEARLSEQAKK